MDQSHIRNFAIIAHIDHGKSTLADRLLELTGTIQKRQMQEQVLDSNPIERERGITIKLAPVRMEYRDTSSKFKVQSAKLEDLRHQDNNVTIQQCNNESKIYGLENGTKKTEDLYILNLIDTPGHVDFGYEVSRSLAACEGALLVVDSTQGVQAQTLANLHQARLHNLVIIPIINKIDLPNARIEETMQELRSLGFREEEVIQISAKTGKNVEQVLDAIVTRIPAPIGQSDKPLRALIFSSQYDSHKGVVVFIRVVDGFIGDRQDALVANKNFDPSSVSSSNTPSARSLRESEAGQNFVHSSRLRFMASGAEVEPIEIGYFTPKMVPSDALQTGDVGYIATGFKDVRFAKVGDTITQVQNSKFKVPAVAKAMAGKQMSNSSAKQDLALGDNVTIQQFNNSAISPLPGYKEPKSMVFLGLFPLNSDEFTGAREAMEKLRLSDSAFTFRPIASLALGNGFHCGFLGLLHAEVVQERLSREMGFNMIATAPSVEYLIKCKVQNAKCKVEEDGYMHIQSAAEFPDPSIIEEVREPIMQVTVFSPKRYVGAIMQLSQEKRGEYIDLKYQADQAEFTYLIPLSEMIIDFFDRLKSVTEGYASLDYEFFEYQTVHVDKVDILVNKEKVDALSFLVVREQAMPRAREIVERLATVIPRQQFLIPIQGAIGGQVIARADVKAFRKDVIQKLYGGDRTRKDKLLDKQKKGKAKMKMIGRVEIPQTAFFEVLKRE